MTARADWADLNPRLLERCGGLCEVCGEPLPANWERQHRRSRHMGGTKRLDVHSLPNLLALDPECHDRIERRERKWAFDCGYAVHQGKDPALVPFLRHGRMWTLLLPDGSYGVETVPAPW